MSTTAAPPAGETSAIASRLAAQHVGSLVTRVERSTDGRPFGNAEADGVAAMALASAVGKLHEGPTRLILKRVLLRCSWAALAADTGPGAPLIAHAALISQATIGEDEARSIVTQAREQSDPRDDAGLLGPAWRALLLAESIRLDPDAPAADLDRLLRQVVSRCGPLAMRTGRRTVADLSQTSRFVYVVSELARARGDARLKRAGTAVFQPLAAQVPSSGLPAGTDGPVPSRVLAQMVLAASLTGATALRNRLLHGLTTHQDEQRSLAKGGKGQANPWVPFALLAAGARLDGLDEIVAPAVPDPPEASLGAADRRRDRIAYTSSEGRIEVDGRLVGLVLDRAIDALGGSPASGLDPRSAAERMLALAEVDRVSDELATRDFADRHIAACLQQLVALQRPDGSFPRSSASGAAALAVDDLACVGTALALGVQRAGDLELRSALERVRDHLLDRIGQVEHAGHMVWRSAPTDSVTARAGAPLERQLAVARFLSELVRTERAPVALSQTLALFRATLADVATRLADPVAIEQLSSEQAALTALALADSATVLGDRRARRLARAVLAETARRMLDSGAIPAVAVSVEETGGERRSRPHRDGIGPWPIRLSTQLWMVAASAAAGGNRDAAARALGFALLHLVDEPRGMLTAGYNRIGRRAALQADLPLDLVPAALRAVASVRAATGLRVDVRRGTTRTAAERSLLFLKRLRGDGAAGGATTEARLALLAGDTVVAVVTRDESGLKRAAAGIRAALSAAPMAPVPQLHGEATAPPDLVRARVSLLGAQIARVGYAAGADVVTARQALAACESFTLRTAREGGRGPRLDLRSTGGLRPWALALGLVAATNRGEAARAAVWQTMRTVLAAQHQDGWWPALAAGDEPLDVHLTVIEQLLAVERDVSSDGAVRRALALGGQAIEQLDPGTALAERIRALAARLRIAMLHGDVGQREDVREELLNLLETHRAPFGTLAFDGADVQLQRARTYAALATVHAADADWLR